MKSIVPKCAAAAAFLILGAAALNINTFATVANVPCIMYHSVKNPPESEFSISTSMFESDMFYLKQHGYKSITLKELLKYANNGKPLPDRVVLITFDDGYSDVLYNALPILDRYEYSAVMSVTVSSIGKRLSSFPHMTSDELRLMKSSGRFELISHSYDLHRLDDRIGSSIKPNESDKEYRKVLFRDLSRSFSKMSETANGIRAYAYPYCAVSDESVPVLETLGVKAALVGESLPEGAAESEIVFIRRLCRNGTHTRERFFEYFNKFFSEKNNI